MDQRFPLVLALFCAVGHNVPTSASTDRPELEISEIKRGEDVTSLLQLSASPAPPRQRVRPSASTHNLSSSAAPEHRRAKLRRKIKKARASLAMMEAELSELDDHLSEADIMTGYDRNAHTVSTDDYAKQSADIRDNKKRWRWEARSHTEGISFMQVASQTKSLSSARSQNGDNNLFIGTVLYQGGVTQAFAEGEGCLNIPGVASIGGPSGLPDYLAYFANKIATEGASLSIGEQIGKVSQAFNDLLPDAGTFHTVKIDLSMAGSQCMVQDRLNFSPLSKACHIGLVWAGDSAREFWITSYGGDGSEIRNQNMGGGMNMMQMAPMQMSPMNQMNQMSPMNPPNQMNMNQMRPR